MKDKVLSILAKIRPEFDFSKDINFFEKGMIDSFDLVIFVSELDAEFGISIDGLDMLPENFSSLDKIVELIKKNGAKE